MSNREEFSFPSLSYSLGNGCSLSISITFRIIMQFNLGSRSSTVSVYTCILMLPVFNIQNSPISAHLEIEHTSRAMHFESVAKVFRLSKLQT